jgi:hypothetical protein
MDRDKILRGEEMELDEMDSLVLSNKDDLSNEDVLKKLVESVKDMKFADASKNES